MLIAEHFKYAHAPGKRLSDQVGASSGQDRRIDGTIHFLTIHR
jgi:hypothetical protein